MKKTFLFDAGGAGEGAGGKVIETTTLGLVGEATPTEISEWKEANKGGIYALRNDTNIIYFREPTRHDVNKAYAVADDNKPLSGLEEFARLTYIGGSKQMLTDDKMFLGLQKGLKAKMTGNLATVVNL